MPETSVISSQEFISDCKKKNTCSVSIECKYVQPSDGKSLNIKENSKLSCCCNGSDCVGSHSRLANEDDLRELLLVVKNQKKRNGLGQNNSSSSHQEWAQFYSFPRLLLSNNTNENHLDPFILQPSLFHKNHVPPTIYFNTRNSPDSRPPIGMPKHLQHYFKWKLSSITPNSIRNCISFMKFDTIKPSNTTETFFLGSWCKHMLTAEFLHLEEWRKVNHIPGSFHLGRKDKLSFRLSLTNQRFSNEKFVDFHPTTFVMPKDYEDLCEYWESSPSKLFIIKPPASARGNGIKVINDVSQVPPNAVSKPLDGLVSKKSTMIVQQYISNPCLLENGQKFDLRVYVLLTSVDPLRIYVYEEGLVRFASAKYTSQEDGIIDQYMHLTNYFINKNNQEYKINNDCDSLHGCKWTLKRFWRYLNEHYPHIDTSQLWEKIIDIIIKTIICCEKPMARLSHQNCKNDYTSYELFGFDIILDKDFKPWILEVNITPSLRSESDLDTKVKYAVIKDMFNLVGYNLPPQTSTDLSNICNSREYKLAFDNRYYNENLTRSDKVKHSKFTKVFKQENLNHDSDASQEMEKASQVPRIEGLEINGRTNTDQHTSANGKTGEESSESSCATGDNILRDLTQNDIRVLMLAEDEFSRCGQFRRVFPSTTSSRYLKYFEKPRYYNLLLDAWEQKYKDDRLAGISLLSAQATFME